jgi:hypothetical protein
MRGEFFPRGSSADPVKFLDPIKKINQVQGRKILCPEVREQQRKTVLRNIHHGRSKYFIVEIAGMCGKEDE